MNEPLKTLDLNDPRDYGRHNREHPTGREIAITLNAAIDRINELEARLSEQERKRAALDASLGVKYGWEAKDGEQASD